MFEHLLSPLSIGSMTVRNRMVMAPMGVEIVDADGRCSEAVIRYYEERARGGVGLIISEVCAVAYPHGANSRSQLGLSSDEFVPGLAELAARVQSHGAKIAVQLVHHGKVSRVDIEEGREVLVASIPKWHGSFDMIEDLTPEELQLMADANGGGGPQYRGATEADLALVIKQFGDAAVRAQEAGFDGVEIHGAHGYLLSGFLSKQWNTREDSYGGTIENRARLLCEVITECCVRTGGDFPIWCRLDALEYRTPDGIVFEDTEKAAELAVAAGAVAVHLSAYGDQTSGPAFSEGTLPYREASHVALAARLKGRVDVPVITVGRLQPETGDEIVAHGKADLIAMGRQMLADPQTALKVAEGRPADVRPCINCYVCVAQPFFDRQVRCAVNPALARETERGDVERSSAAISRRVVIVGGGPAGMEAARIAATRGHVVTLFEQAPQLGGALRFAAVVYEPNKALLDWMILQLHQLKVDVRLGTEPSAAGLQALEPDTLIVATGARRESPAIEGVESPHVIDGDHLRSMLTGVGPSGDASTGSGPRLSWFGRAALFVARRTGLTDDPDMVASLSRYYMPLGKRVAVIGGGLVGIELAEFLAERGRQVTVLETGSTMAVEMAHPRRWRVLHDLRAVGAQLVTGADVLEINKSSVRYRIGDSEEAVACDSVVIAAGLTSDPTLADALRAAGLEPVVIGDCRGVGYMEGAIRDGYEAGLAAG